MKVVIIPDVHNKFHLIDPIIKKEQPDKIVYLGDWFDSYNDLPIQNKLTAEYLKNILYDHNKIFLYGNHDIQYRYHNNIYIRSTAYSDDKYNIINSVLTNKDWNQFKLYTIINDNWFLSHAGISFQLVCNPILGFNVDYFNRILEQDFQDLKLNKDQQLLGIGKMRGGYNKIGGITWCDITEFEPIDNINQVFGHTNIKNPIQINTNVLNSENWCIDCYLTYYGIIENDKFHLGIVKEHGL